MSAANRLFADPYGLPKSNYLFDSENSEAPWQSCELDATQQEPGNGKNSVFAVRKPGVIGKFEPTTPTRGKAVAPLKETTSRAAKAVNSKLNDKQARQVGQKACLLGQGYGLVDGDPVQAWHAAQEPKADRYENAKRTPGTPMKTKTQAQKRAATQPIQASLEFVVSYPNGLTPRQAKEVEVVARHTYTFPRVFVLLVQIAHLTDLQVRSAAYATEPGHDEIVTTVTTEQLLKRFKHPTAEGSRALQSNLELACAIGLLEMDGQRTIENKDAFWKLTSDGKRFLLAGLKARKMLRKTNRFASDEDQCAQISVDELEDWQLEAQDRAAILANDDGNSKKSSCRTLLSREEFVVAIEERAKKRVQASEVNNLWCGLVR